jgi:16S rRNA processing protein RimM
VFFEFLVVDFVADSFPDSPAPDELYAILRLTRPHGLRGEIGALYLAPEVLDFRSFVIDREFWPRLGGSLHPPKLKVLAARPHGRQYLLTLANTPDRTAAEALRGVELCLARSELPPLPEGWHWEADLIGLAVRDSRLGEIGTVAGLDQKGGQWSIIVRRPDGGEVAIPWAKPLVGAVDIASGVVRTDLPLDYPGLPSGE